MTFARRHAEYLERNREEWRALVASEGGYRDVSAAEAFDVMRDKLQRLYGVYGGKEAA